MVLIIDFNPFTSTLFLLTSKMKSRPCGSNAMEGRSTFDSKADSTLTQLSKVTCERAGAQSKEPMIITVPITVEPSTGRLASEDKDPL